MIENNFLKFSMFWTVLRGLTFIESQLLFPSIGRTNCGDMPLPRALSICKARFLPPSLYIVACSPNSQLPLLPPGQVRGRCLSLVPFGFNLVLPSRPLTPTSPCMEATTFQDIPWEIRISGYEVCNDPCGSEHFRVLCNSEWSSVRKKKRINYSPTTDA